MVDVLRFLMSRGPRNSKLFKLLDLNHDDEEEKQTLDCDAVIKEVQNYPHSAELQYRFSRENEYVSMYEPDVYWYPLHKAIKLNAPLHVIDALCNAQALSGEGAVTALYLEIQYRSSYEVVNLLLKKQPDTVRAGHYATAMKLHFACKNPSFEVVSMLFDACPVAIRVKNVHGYIPLHDACIMNAPFEVIKLLISAWPDSIRVKSCREKCTPVHFALMNPLLHSEVVPFLLDQYPDAAKEKDCHGDTPLHLACRQGAPMNLVSQILDSWPDAIKEKSGDGSTALHSALRSVCPNPLSEVVRLLLEKWPAATKEKDNSGKTPYEVAQRNHASVDILKPLFLVSTFYDNKMIDAPPSPIRVIHIFTDLEWWNGMALVMDRYHIRPQSLSLETNVVPAFFSVVGRSCKLKTLWEVLRNEQDLFSDS